MTKKIFTTIILTIILFCGLLAGSIYLTRHLTAKAEQGNNKPTPSEEITIDGKYYLDLDGSIKVFEIEGNSMRAYDAIWENGMLMCYDYSILQYKVIDNPIDELEFFKYQVKETDKYIECYVDETMKERFMIYEKDTHKLYYDFSGGEQQLGNTYEDQLILELTKFTESGLHEHNYSEWTVKQEPTITTFGLKTRKCSGCGVVDGEELPCKEFVIQIEENILTIPAISSGTNNLYYREVGTDNYSAYVIGDVTTFDLTTLLTRDYEPMQPGKTYEIYVMYDYFSNTQTSNTLTYTTPSNESYAGYWLYDIEDAGTWVIRMTETTFEIAEATKVDGKYQLSGAFELVNLNANTLIGTHLVLMTDTDDTSEVYLYFDTATNLLVYGGMNATRITEEDVVEHTHNMQLIRTEGTECIGTTSYYKCSECGKEETITSLGIGHSFDQISIGGGNVERIPATCTSPAYDKEKCTREGCNEYLLTPVEGSSALGHDYGEWVIDSTKNIVVKTCSRCADKVTKEFEIPSSFFGWYKVPEINLLEGVGGNLIFIDNSNNFKIASIHEFENIYDITHYELITKYSIKYVDDKLELVLEDYGAYAALQNNSLKTLKFNLNTQQLCFEFSAEEIYYSEKISDKYVYAEQYFYEDGDTPKGVLYNVEHALFGKYEAETRDGKEKHYFYFTPSEFSEITADGEVIKTFNKLSSINIDNTSMIFQFLEEKDSRTNTAIMFSSEGVMNLIMDDIAYYSVTKINS